VPGHHILELFQGDAGEEILDAANRTLEGGSCVRLRGLRFTSADGSSRWLDVSCSVLGGSASCAGGVVITADDVTEAVDREKHEARIRLLRSIGRMAASAAHEIGNPLGAITACSTSLLSRGRIHGADRELLQIVVDESRRLKDIVVKFFSLEPPVGPCAEEVTVSELLQDLVRSFENEARFGARGGKISLRESYDSSIPPISGDSARLRVAFQHLIANAIEAMPAGGVIGISVRRASAEGMGADSLRIGIADNGVGIVAKDLPHVAEPFYTSKSEHVGIGLAIASQVISEHGGTLNIESQYGKGTSVEVILPGVS
jgi:signal transduction histidine kinase